MKEKLFIVVSNLILICACSSSNMISSKGVISYIELEGGFYGIVTSDNINYRPLNLSDRFKIDGLQVQFKGKVRDDAAGIHMWGEVIEIEEINANFPDSAPVETDYLY